MAIVRLSCGSLSADVIKLSKQKLDQQFKNAIFEDLKIVIESIKDEINIIHQDMEKCRERIQKIEDIHIPEMEEYKDRIQMIEDIHIPSNIRRKCDIELSLNFSKYGKEVDELYYNSTNVYQVKKDIVESSPTVTLVGGPGCGKTATARHIALLYEQNGWEIVPVFRSDEIVLYGDSKLKQIFVLDDILGVFAVDMSLYNNINNHREDLESMENILNDEEKEKLLAKHCRFTGVPDDMYCNLSLSSSFIMFPLLCKIFFNKVGTPCICKFFASPFACLSNELDMMARSTPQLYGALVMYVLSNNVLSVEKITVVEKEMKLDVYNTCGVNLGISDREIQTHY
ncbi:unnamed protein product [Mytilus coruscus]|uniref:Novel STAND NTPase 3 domain-containing protein n=1 Tax=Mytilus coruscus TaxID=42192 RepID=A0A6J8AF54_MYTCO|nr:unnamed protein product [Mytilus coruscus]